MSEKLKDNNNSVKGFKNYIIRSILFICASISLITTVLIIGTLIVDSVSFFSEVPIFKFLTGTNWNPAMKPYSFGVLPLIWGTLMITGISALVSMPLGIGTAIYLSEYADKRIKKTVKPLLEILAGIPTVVYGFFALTFITPIIKAIFPETSIYNALSGGIVVGIMTLPMVSSLSEDAMSSVPESLKNGGYALGATKFEVTSNIVIPASISGIVSSFILALSRAIGETMAVTIAAGRLSQMTLNPLKSIETMTAAMVEVAQGDIAADALAYKSLFAIGLILFIMTLGMNMFGQWIRSRYREEYR